MQLASQKQIDVGVIGLGGAGRAHVQRLRRNSAVGRIVVFDIKQTGVDLVGVEHAGSITELLHRVDAVSICTPDHVHLDNIISSLQAGKHVLVAKPMVASQAEALELGKHIGAHSGLVFGIHHQMRHAPPFEKAATLIADGTLGRVFYLEANYWHDMKSRSVKYDNWRMEQGQSLIFGHSCHPLDLLMHLVGSAPLSHTTYVSKIGFDEYPADYTSATTMMVFPGNVVAKCHVNSCCVFPQFNNLIVLGDRASYIDGILFRDGKFEQVSDFFGSGKSTLAVNVVDIKIPRKLVSLAFNVYLRTFNWLSNRLMSHPDFGFRQTPLTVYNHDGACQVMIDNFIAAIQGKEKILVGYEDATRVIKLCEEAERDGLRNMR